MSSRNRGQLTHSPCSSFRQNCQKVVRPQKMHADQWLERPWRIFPWKPSPEAKRLFQGSHPGLQLRWWTAWHPAHQKSRSLEIITHPRTPPILSIFFMSQYIHSQPVFLPHSINDTFLKSQSVLIHHIVYFRRLGLIHHWFLTSSFSPIPSIDTAFYLIKNGPVFAS